MAKSVADTNSGSNQGGFTEDGSNITGFSHLHDSGTGGSPSLGNFALFPYAACPNDDPDGCNFLKTQRAIGYQNGSLNATPGYFALTLDSGVKAEMTAAMHTTLFRFTFPTGSSGSPLILLDLTDLSDSRQNNATVTVDGTSGRLSGGGVFEPSFGSGNYTAYFCADFQGSGVRDNGIFVNSRANSTIKTLQVSRGINSIPLPAGAWTRFTDDTPVLARVGLSFISSDRACSNAENEIPTYDFEGIQDAAVTAWRNKLSPVQVSPASVDQSYLTNFYSGIYRAFINPQNYTGENPLFSSPFYFDSFYCIWDEFRAQLPFLTILDPDSVSQMIQSLTATYQASGWLPDCRMSLCKGFTQGGSNADVVMADAYVKNLTNGIDYSIVYEAVVNDAENEPYDWSNEGRGGLDSWHNLGYIPVLDFDYKGFGTFTRSISRTLEYAYNDFCVAQIANGLGNGADATKYNGRSENWQNIFKANQTSDLMNSTTSTGFTGFFQPKYLNGTWGFQDPLECSNIDTTTQACSLTNNGPETFESSIWEYQFYVPQDQAALINTYGGADQFVARLNYLHNNNITYIGNEPAFLTVFQYHYAGRPALSALRSHYYIPSQFQPTPAGLPGNDDSGAMGSFVAFNMLGVFPVPGQNVYLIIPPYFESVSVTSPLTGKTANITNINFDPTYQNVYIQNATLNGQPYTKNWIDHSFFLNGGDLVLYLGSTESAWGTGAINVPPSLTASPLGAPGVPNGNGTNSTMMRRSLAYKPQLGMEGGANLAGAYVVN